MSRLRQQRLLNTRPMEMPFHPSLPAIRVCAETEFSLEFDDLTDPKPAGKADKPLQCVLANIKINSVGKCLVLKRIPSGKARLKGVR